MATVIEQKVEFIAPKKYVIELSEREAAVLGLVLAKVGGGHTTLRKYVESLTDQLNSFTNISWYNFMNENSIIDYLFRHPSCNGIYFENRSIDNPKINKLYHPQ